MEVLKRPALLFTLVFLFTGCEYIGFDGYINQLEELGITHDLADAVSFDQHLASRPREFRGEVYVLGTRGVFVMDADRLSSYRFYPYTNGDQLEYHSDYWEERLPPINCYLRPEDGRVVISSLNSDQGLRYGDTLTLYENPDRAVYMPVDPAWMGSPPVTLLNTSGVTAYVKTDIFNNGEDTLELIDDPVTYTILETATTVGNEFVLNQSIRNSSDGAEITVVTQLGSTFPWSVTSTLNVHRMSPGSWNFAAVGSLFIEDSIEHDEYKWTGADYFISGGLDISTNSRYLLVWGESFSDEDTMLIYDYTSGEMKLRSSVPGNSSFPELAESGMTIYTSSIRGGVAKYVYD